MGDSKDRVTTACSMAAIISKTIAFCARLRQDHRIPKNRGVGAARKLRFVRREDTVSTMLLLFFSVIPNSVNRLNCSTNPSAIAEAENLPRLQGARNPSVSWDIFQEQASWRASCWRAQQCPKIGIGQDGMTQAPGYGVVAEEKKSSIG
jgi:hypothetical protein